MGENIKNKIGKATAWSSITEIMAKIISPIVNIILARLLLPEAFGIVATITMVISFAEVFTDAGFQKYIIQHEFENEDDLDKSTNVAFWTNLSVSFFACVIIFLFRHKIAFVVGSPGLGNSISLASLLIILYAFSSIQMARYKRDFDFKTLFFVRIGTSLIPLLVTIPLAIILKNYWALLVGNFASQLFNAIFLTIKSKWKPKIYYNFALFKKMFSFSAWTLLESIFIWLTANIDIFIVGSYFNEYYVGLYKTSMTTISSYMGLITATIIPILFSSLSRYQNDEKQFKSTYFSFLRLTAIFVLPMGIGIFLFSDVVTMILLGDQWMEASGFIGLWGLTSALNIIFAHFASEVYRSKGKPVISLVTQVIQIAFLVPVLLISINYGFKVVYWARSLVRIELIISAFLFLRVLYKFKITDILKNTVPAIVASIIMATVGYGLKVISESFIWQFIAIGICIAVYFLALFVLFPKIRKEVFESQYVKKIIKKFSKQSRTVK